MTFTSVVDGDTITTSAGVVRLIGIDAPERGECGHSEAAQLVSTTLSPGDKIVLELPDGENDRDQRGRLLRYVDTATGIDLGLEMLTAGLAVARYDSTDGYPNHPRETDYHDAELAVLTMEGVVTTVACRAAAEQEAAAAAEQARVAAAEAAAAQAAADQAAAQAVDEWWRQYSSCTKLSQSPNGHSTGPFSRDNPDEAAIYDWFESGTGNHGDGDGDGLACE